jgi:nitroreductase
MSSMPIPVAQMLERLHWRYAVKRFDPGRKLDAETWEALEESLILAPSSFGLQPWKFVVVTDPAIKAKLPEISYNQKQPLDCSHMVVLAARESMNADYVRDYIQTVETERGLPSDTLSKYRDILISTVAAKENQLDWNARQVYIALGQLMVAAAMLGVDTCPMEGILADEYDKLLGLTGSGFATVVGCAVGYRHPEDTQAEAKKVRFTDDVLVQRI